MEECRMGLLAVGDFAFWPLCTVLRRVAALEAVKAQPFYCQALNPLLNGGIGKDVADLCRVHPPADPTDVVNLLLWRRRN